MLHLKNNERFIDFAKREIIILKPGQVRYAKGRWKSMKELHPDLCFLSMYTDIGMAQWGDYLEPGYVELTTKN